MLMVLPRCVQIKNKASGKGCTKLYLSPLIVFSLLHRLQKAEALLHLFLPNINRAACSSLDHCHEGSGNYYCLSCFSSPRKTKVNKY